MTAFLPGFRGDPAAATVAGAEVLVDFTLAIAPLAETVTVTRSEQDLDNVANAVTVLGTEALGFAERKASLDEALHGVPGLTVQNRRDYGLTGGIALSVRAPPFEPMLGIPVRPRRDLLHRRVPDLDLEAAVDRARAAGGLAGGHRGRHPRRRRAPSAASRR